MKVDPAIVILSLSKDDDLAKTAPFDRLRVLAKSKSRCSTKERDKTPSELVSDLLDEWYDVKLRRLHRQYLAGDLTLRGMARRLGLEYRELYDLLEAQGLTV